jgi:hypothetical protein
MGYVGSGRKLCDLSPAVYLWLFKAKCILGAGQIRDEMAIKSKCCLYKATVVKITLYFLYYLPRFTSTGSSCSGGKAFRTAVAESMFRGQLIWVLLSLVQSLQL